MDDRPSKRDCVLVGRFFLFCLVFLAIVQSLHLPQARSQEVADKIRASVCRVSNTLTQFNNLGSGTLIDVTAGGEQGLVLTCAHLFSEGAGHVVVTFGDGKTHLAKLMDRDIDADLALLTITSPGRPPATVRLEPFRQQELRVCGYGTVGMYKCGTGGILGQASGEGRVSLQIAGRVRSGDSGGGVFDTQGRLVAVIWGFDKIDSVTYASYGKPLQNFLGKTLARFRPGSQRSIVVNKGCVGGVCPRPPQPNRRPAAIRPWPVQQQPNHRPACDQLSGLESRIAALESREPKAGPSGQDGKDGRDGTDAAFDRQKMEDRIAAQVLAKTSQSKPFFIRVDRNAPYRPVSPGQYVTLPLRKAIQQAQP